uniref:N-acetyltransferase ECO1 n=1 Tax=Ditylenchus dipsaci TaxID=166011 RepID=A0A915D2W6_9BILA
MYPVESLNLRHMFKTVPFDFVFYYQLYPSLCRVRSKVSLTRLRLRLCCQLMITPPSNKRKSQVCSLRSGSKTPKRSPQLKYLKREDRFHQTIIDAGQSKIGLEHCQKCGMVYNVDDKKDVEQHYAFHNRFVEKKSFKVTTMQLNSWKRSLQYESSCHPLPCSVFRLNNFSKASLKRKFEESYVNEELGYCSDLPIWDSENLRQALVFVVEANQKEPAFIGAILLVDRVDNVMLMPQQKKYHGQFLGVNRIWVHSQVRRKGIAAFLLDIARRLLASGGTLPKSRVAFSEPTESGIKLAISYIGDQENGRYIAYSLNSPQRKPEAVEKIAPVAESS